MKVNPRYMKEFYFLSFISQSVKNPSNQFIVQNIILWRTTERCMKVPFFLPLYP